MPEEPSNYIFEIGVPYNIHTHTNIIALHAVFIKIRGY